MPTLSKELKPESMRPGSLLAFSGANLTSDIINIGTLGCPRLSISHVGIIGRYQNEIVLFESTTLTDLPCLIQGKSFKGTQVHRIPERVNSYAGKCWYYPLYRDLYDHEEARLNEFLIAHVGIAYDKIGAIRSLGLGIFEYMLFGQDLSSLFCSEWAAAAHATTGLLTTANDSRWNPNYLLRYERSAGILREPRRLS